jgi:GTPase SAR1 family protein
VDGYVLLYSIDSRSSLDKLELVHEKLLNLIGDNIPRVLVGNKSDLATMREVSLEEGQAAAGRFGVPFLECSAKEGFNISASKREAMLREDELCTCV